MEIYITLLVQVNKKHHQPQHQWLGITLELSRGAPSASTNSKASIEQGAVLDLKIKESRKHTAINPVAATLVKSHILSMAGHCICHEVQPSVVYHPHLYVRKDTPIVLLPQIGSEVREVRVVMQRHSRSFHWRRLA